MEARGQRILGWYQVVGGITGLISISLHLANAVGGIGPLPVLIGAAGFFLGLGLAGALLLRGHRWGRPLSLAAQALQVPKLFTVAISYEAYGPLTASIVLEPAHWTLNLGFELGGGFYFGLGAEPLAAMIGINLAAAAVLWLLLRKPAAQALPTSGGLVTR